MSLPELARARVAILGAGREGMAAWRYLRAAFPDAELTLVDERPPEAGQFDRLGEPPALRCGPLSEAGLEHFDLLVRSPGISPYRDEIRQALAAGVAITSPSSLWFAAHPRARTICVTGTKGKSTTSALLAHVLGAAGRRVRLAGNIGRPLLDCDDRGVDWWVIELSSYQLADLEARPSLAVLLNLSSEHLDWHRGEANYRRDKLRLAGLAGANPVVANAGDPVLRAALAGHGHVRWFNADAGLRVDGNLVRDGDRPLPLTMPEGLPGAHNLANVAAVLAVVRELGEDVEQAAAAIASFRSLPHRLQSLGRRDGLRWVNDSISTAPVATAAALEALAGEDVVLIVGGFERGVDWAPYVSTFARRSPRAVIGVPDNGPDILRALSAGGVRPEGGLHEAESLEGAVALARRVAPAGAVVLLSPGAPSFPHFRDFRERGRKFAHWAGLAFDDREPYE